MNRRECTRRRVVETAQRGVGRGQRLLCRGFSKEASLRKRRGRDLQEVMRVGGALGLGGHEEREQRP